MSSGDEIEMETETSRKRKGGSIGDSPPSLKRQNSCPNIKESSLASAVFEAKYVNVGDIIVKSFQDTKFIEKITPVLTAVVTPLIKTAINEAVVNAVSAIEKGTVAKLKTENDDLRMSAGYNYLFKLFSLHHFFASKIYNRTFNTKIAIG